MKKSVYYSLALMFFAFIFNSCEEDPYVDPFPGEEVVGCYIVNYGNYGSGGASISKYDYRSDKMINFYYQAQNSGSELLSNIQYAFHYNDSVYMLGNDVDQILVVNALFKRSINGVTNQIAKPRYGVISGNYMYVSCWGSNPDWSEMPDTYIAKYNITTNVVDETIPMPGGPEGLAIANGNLYIALNYKDSIAVINLGSKDISYIVTPAVTSYFVHDAVDNLYVTLVSTWTNFSSETGLGYINTSSNQLEATYKIADVSTGYGTMIATNPGLTKIYLVTSAYDENWNLSGSVSEFDVPTKSFASESFVSGISGLSGIAVNPKDANVYVFKAESTTSAGSMEIYSNNGTFLKEYSVGAAPSGAFFID